MPSCLERSFHLICFFLRLTGLRGNGIGFKEVCYGVISYSTYKESIRQFVQQCVRAKLIAAGKASLA